LEQREAAAAEAQNGDGGQGAAGGLPASDPSRGLPPILRRRYRVYFQPPTKVDVHKLREVRATHIGKLVTVSGIVTRVGDVKPLMEVACYTCDSCGFEIYQEVTGDAFMPVQKCPTPACGGAHGAAVHLQTRACKFVKFQELRMQELSTDVPMGHIPRSITVVVKGDLCRCASPGDILQLTGIFLPKPVTGFKAMRAGLCAHTYLEAQAVVQHKKRYSDVTITPDVAERIEALHEQPDTYGRLARSIAPQIYGHDDVKKALLLLLVGGTSRQLPDGMRIRGDVHICLMGDPGVAKSQLLKHICAVAPRGVYTTGKGSSGVGLTAAVVKDSLTGEFMLEGGALVLADMGICCIDEFDKMDESDRTAIHEVMEQQTVSIAKAGITTTLNARTSVLAAANPVGGRYNTSWSPQENINLPAALLSRFDLLWLILDRADEERDTALAAHVLHVHRTLAHPPLEFEPLAPSDLRAYVALARRVEPHFPEELTEYVANTYAEIRAEEAERGDQAASYTTVRTLLSILRMAHALARLRFAPEVAQSDVDEALRLMRMSKASLADEEAHGKGKGGRGGRYVDPISDIFCILRDLAGSRRTMVISYEDAVGAIARKAYGTELLDACLEEYESLAVWQVNEDRSIEFLAA